MASNEALYYAESVIGMRSPGFLVDAIAEAYDVAFNAGAHSRDAEIERLQTSFREEHELVGVLQQRELDAAQKDWKLRQEVADRTLKAQAKARLIKKGAQNLADIPGHDVLPQVHRLSNAEVMSRLHPEVVHGCPPAGSGQTTCCHLSPWDLPVTDRMTLQPDLVTCTGERPKPEYPDLDGD